MSTHTSGGPIRRLVRTRTSRRVQVPADADRPLAGTVRQGRREREGAPPAGHNPRHQRKDTAVNAENTWFGIPQTYDRGSYPDPSMREEPDAVKQRRAGNRGLHAAVEAQDAIERDRAEAVRRDNGAHSGFGDLAGTDEMAAAVGEDPTLLQGMPAHQRQAIAARRLNLAKRRQRQAQTAGAGPQDAGTAGLRAAVGAHLRQGVEPEGDGAA